MAIPCAKIEWVVRLDLLRRLRWEWSLGEVRTKEVRTSRGIKRAYGGQAWGHLKSTMRR